MEPKKIKPTGPNIFLSRLHKGKLSGPKIELDEMMVISAIMRALPPSFSTFLEAWSMFDVDQQTQNRFVSKVLERARNIAEQEDGESALVAIARDQERPFLRDGGQGQDRGNDRGNGRGRSRGRGRGSYGNSSYTRGSSAHAQFSPSPRDSTSGQIVCHYCKKLGHVKADCFKLKNKQEREKSGGEKHPNFDGAEICNMAIASCENLPPTKISQSGRLVTTWIVD